MNSSYNLSYIDFLSAVLVVIVSLFMALALQDMNEAKGNILDKSEFIIEMEWADSSVDDIDLWVQNPTGEIVWFQNMDVGLMTLDRDQKGNAQNVVTLENGRQILDPVRREVVSLRATLPGKYAINAVLFSHMTGKEVPVKVKVRKLNPYIEIWEGTKTLKFKGDQVTFITFELDDKGNASNVDQHAVVDLLKSKLMDTNMTREP